MFQEARKRQGCPRKPGTGRNVPKSQETAGMSEKAKDWQKCPRKSENGQDVPESQKTAGMSQEKHPEKLINDGNTRSRSRKSRNDREAWLMSFALPGGAGPTPFRFYETTCALLSPACDRPLQVFGLSNNDKNPCTCRGMAESSGRSRCDRKSPGGREMTEKPREKP
ncbi:hypothetical protein Taro_037935 [Colocasia esculenta]|uniref:Uncharacterized protein n=1 Tax=Colocasia esculenta TaxID=4460 RepID=A0A843WR69_COLES|nr:hypothetical protein [Colocasia esculenta]